MSRKRVMVVIGAVVVAAAGVGIGLAVASNGGSNSGGMMGSESNGSSMNSYYASMMGSYGGQSIMGGSQGSTTSNPSYAWMMGGTNAPGWMHGGTLPASMMRTSSDVGAVMGKLFANAPGDRVSSAEATRLGNEKPTGASVDTTDNRITFFGATARLVVLASPSGGPNETYRAAGLVNPTIVVKSGSRVSIEVVNADGDAANGLVVTAKGSASSAMPMLTADPSFSGSAMWFLGNSTSAGMHTGTLSFTANTSGSYQYLCPVPGHAREGMAGIFTVTG
jgi:rusticyanin